MLQRRGRELGVDGRVLAETRDVSVGKLFAVVTRTPQVQSVEGDGQRDQNKASVCRFNRPLSFEEDISSAVRQFSRGNLSCFICVMVVADMEQRPAQKM